MRRLGLALLMGGLVLLACYDFDEDLQTCGQPGFPCAAGDAADSGAPDVGDAGSADAGSADGGVPDAGDPDAGPVRGVSCTESFHCQSNRCSPEGCCDESCAATVQVVTGDSFTCALLSTGRVRCWGRNHLGQLGLGYVGALPDGGSLPDGGVQFVTVPTDVPGLENVQALAAGVHFACAHMRDGTVRCWGHNASGQLGRGSLSPLSDGTPQPVVSLDRVKALRAGGYHACALMENDELWCWGANDTAQLGIGALGDRETPTPVCHRGSGATCSPLTSVRDVALGSFHTCATTQAGAVYCWGAGERGQLARKIDGFSTPVPDPAQGLDVGTEPIALGDYTSCAVRGGQVRCWGANTTGNGDAVLLGRGPDAGEATQVPAPVCTSVTDGQCTPLEGAAEVAAFGIGFCARVGGAVYCWGSNAFGQLARQEPSSGNVSDVAQLADAVTSEAAAPLLSKDVTQIEGSASHLCALVRGGVLCWGSNGFGQIGDKTSSTAESRPPTRPAW